MATTINNILSNWYWRIEQIPTSSLSNIGRKRFHRINPKLIDDDESAGIERGFWVKWNGSDMDGEVTDQYQRTTEHEWELTVVYWGDRDWKDLHELILMDRHVLLDKLRDQSLYVGYSDSNLIDDIGLIDRVRRSDNLDVTVEDMMCLYKSTWTTNIREVE